MNVNKSQDVRLDLPRVQFDPNRKPSRSWMLPQQPQQPRQEWVTSAVQGTPRAALTVKLPVRKLVIAVAVFMGMMFCVGLGSLVGQQQPDATTVATLHYAQSHAPAGETCGAVWLDGADHWTVECGSIGG